LPQASLWCLHICWLIGCRCNCCQWLLLVSCAPLLSYWPSVSVSGVFSRWPQPGPCTTLGDNDE
jgi:hypothetical protein